MPKRALIWGDVGRCLAHPNLDLGRRWQRRGFRIPSASLSKAETKFVLWLQEDIDRCGSRVSLVCYREIRIPEYWIREVVLEPSKPGILPRDECGVDDVDFRRYWQCHAPDVGVKCYASECGRKILECFGPVHANADVRRSSELHDNECHQRNVIRDYRVQLQVERPQYRGQQEP